jgi:hypothetical protein
MLYFFLLLAPPVQPACVLWIDHAPIANDYLPPVCPLQLMPSWYYYNMRLIGENGEILCEWPADQSITDIPCKPSPANNYHIEAWLKGNTATGCNLWLDQPTYYEEDIASQCPDWLDEYQAGTLEIRGPYEIQPSIEAAPACTLPQADNSISISTANRYQFLANRLSWWGVNVSQDDWQNRWNEQIRGAADAAGVPAGLLKAMIANESQYWPLWTGETGEVGWMQVTWQGADTALRHDPELFHRYCQRTLWTGCTGYDLLTEVEQNAVASELIKDLQVEGTPLDAADMASEDLWTYAHILRAYACYGKELYPDKDVWQSAAVLYNAGSNCIQGDLICSQGEKYLGEVMAWKRSLQSP